MCVASIKDAPLGHSARIGALYLGNKLLAQLSFTLFAHLLATLVSSNPSLECHRPSQDLVGFHPSLLEVANIPNNAHPNLN